MKYQYFADNEGDNRIGQVQYSEMIVFASEWVHLDDNRRVFKLGLLL